MPVVRVRELDLGVRPESAVSAALLLQSEERTFLTFNAVRRDSSGLFQVVGTAVVEFESCQATRFGYPNDEALAGHPLFDKGLDSVGAYEVENSSWIRSIAEQNRISFPNSREDEKTSHHYVFVFHDSTFECVADKFHLEISMAPVEEILADLSRRLLSD